MWGFFDRASTAQGTLDPLYARVLALEAGQKRLAVVVLDLGRTFGHASLQHLRETTKKSSRVEYVFGVASHNHAGPVIQHEYAGNQVPAWETAALDKIAGAIDEAYEHAVEARLGTGHGVSYIGHNRLRVNPDGVNWFERNLTKIPAALLDPTVSVLRVDAADGRSLAILVNYSCHPVIFGADNLRYSADFPGRVNAWWTAPWFESTRCWAG